MSDTIGMPITERYMECQIPGHEFTGNYIGYEIPGGPQYERGDDGELLPDKDGGDSETHVVRILGPKEAVEANGEEFCCAMCAANLATAYIGFGWDVEVKNRDNIGKED